MTDAELIWRSKSDDELLEAAAMLADYTEEGEGLIRAELQRRGLAAPHGDDLITVATFPNMLEASLAKSALEAAGIEALVPGEDAGRLSTGLLSGPYASVRVRLSDYERARDVLDEAKRR